jgi:hypothetical protein
MSYKKINLDEFALVLAAVNSSQRTAQLLKFTANDTHEIVLFLKDNITNSKDLKVGRTKTEYIAAICVLLGGSSGPIDNQTLLRLFADRTQLFNLNFTDLELQDLPGVAAKLPLETLEQIKAAKKISVASKYNDLIKYIRKDVGLKRELEHVEEEERLAKKESPVYLFFRAKGYTVTNDEELMEAINLFIEESTQGIESYKTVCSTLQQYKNTASDELKVLQDLKDSQQAKIDSMSGELKVLQDLKDSQQAKIDSITTELNEALQTYETSRVLLVSQVETLKKELHQPTKTLAEKKVLGNAQGLHQKFLDLNMLTKQSSTLINKI